MSDTCFVYPITPSTPMGEAADQWSTDGRKNLFGNQLQVGVSSYLASKSLLL